MKREHSANKKKKVTMRHYLWLTALCTLAFINIAYAQDSHTITGTVTDEETGATLPGVNILIVGTSTGTTTNLEGDFELETGNPDATLRFSYIGYEELEIPDRKSTRLNSSHVATSY